MSPSDGGDGPGNNNKTVVDTVLVADAAGWYNQLVVDTISVADAAG